MHDLQEGKGAMQELDEQDLRIAGQSKVRILFGLE